MKTKSFNGEQRSITILSVRMAGWHWRTVLAEGGQEPDRVEPAVRGLPARARSHLLGVVN